MLQALAAIARPLAPIAQDAMRNVAQGAGQQLAGSGVDAIKNMMSGQPSGGAVSYANDPSEQKPATY
ncbi:hypothetical protein SAMN05216596_10299 [Pseudomonas congelans]|jgi:hypothetical protein|uniref:Uncharacterized protein n=1 Tax=Pseudomonas congelans TaxID=200452 RepID=A0A0P9LUI5_9PSED|nr:hypothetical protein [Pseudomonas congelans]KFE48523.1 hypothetical protein IV03_04015 [Pseudomonas congelans]KPW82097.1 Unknown protein sequence [Pseudomonas congelans]MCF5165702.1 hypothetical protein [Pseudomonas congelans]PBP93705.1 hypothetical protein CCL17_26610 [Pseudomonas congelans]PBP97830.1 hypothetical protein CCL07_18960 [Pseudomonas congelans]